jgi:hypothetical protein
MFVKLFQMIVMWKVSVDFNEIIRYKEWNKKQRDLEADSESSEVFSNSRRFENTVY